MIFNIVVIIVVFLLSYHLYKKNRLYFFCFLPFIVQYLWMFLSILVIENGTYVSEQDRDGEFVYANFYLLLYFICSIISFVFFFQLFKRVFKVDFPRIKFLGYNEYKLLLMISFFIISLGILNIIISPSTYTDKTINKFNYWDNTNLKFLKGVLGSTIGYFPFMLGILFSKYKKTVICLCILYLIYLVGVGQKFTAFLYGAISFMTSFIIINTNYSDKKLLVVKKRYLVLISSLLFSLILMKYTDKNPFRHLGLTPLESVFYRAFGLQGHLFWGTSERYLYNNADHSWRLSELPYGMHVLMDDFTPESRKKYLEGAWERGVSWTNAYPSILNRMFPIPLGLLVHFLLFSFVPFFYCLLAKLLKSNSLLLSIIFFQLILWCLNVYSMAYFFRLIKIILIFLIIVYVFYLIRKLRLEREWKNIK